MSIVFHPPAVSMPNPPAEGLGLTLICHGA